MIRFACIFAALGLTAAGPTALAAQPAKPQPAMMTDAQMDDVTAGVFTIVIQGSLNNWTFDSLQLQANIMANVNAAIAGGDATATQVVATQTISVIVPVR